MKARTPLFFLAILALGISGSAAGRKCYDDDPISREPETRDAAGAKSSDLAPLSDSVLNLFGRPGDTKTNVRAQNINTIDEVPDSNWFVSFDARGYPESATGAIMVANKIFWAMGAQEGRLFT